MKNLGHQELVSNYYTWNRGREFYPRKPFRSPRKDQQCHWPLSYRKPPFLGLYDLPNFTYQNDLLMTVVYFYCEMELSRKTT